MSQSKDEGQNCWTAKVSNISGKDEWVYFIFQFSYLFFEIIDWQFDRSHGRKNHMDSLITISKMSWMWLTKPDGARIYWEMIWLSCSQMKHRKTWLLRLDRVEIGTGGFTIRIAIVERTIRHRSLKIRKLSSSWILILLTISRKKICSKILRECFGKWSSIATMLLRKSKGTVWWKATSSKLAESDSKLEISNHQPTRRSNKNRNSNWKFISRE